MIRKIIRTISIRKKPIPQIRPQRICIFKIGAIGDVLVSTPMVHALRQRYPKARIDYWTGQWSAGALEGNKDLDNVVAFDDATFFKKRVDLVIGLARRIASQRYDTMFILDKHWSLGTFGRLCNVPVRIGFDRDGEGFAHTAAVPFGKTRHESDYYLDLAYLAGAKKVKNPKIELWLSAQDKKFASDFFRKNRLAPKKTIGIVPGGAKNPGQNAVVKRWPVERFAEIAKALAGKGWQILLIGRSPGDDDVLPAMLSAVPNAANAIGSFTIRQSAALLQKCRLVICNDSGPMHMAAAVGTPTVSIFGPTDPRHWAPRGPKHIWVWNRVDCTKAMKYGTYDEPHIKMNILKVQPRHVLNAVRRLLGRI
ncbi:MAG: glycosyltransferase family 9 protein [Candidatus Woesearchaeota archaeon]